MDKPKDEETFLDRLVTERLELDDRIQKLAAFLPTPQFRDLPAVQRELLITQLDLMKRYCSVLTQREALIRV